jgi:hypothetical protein
MSFKKDMIEEVYTGPNYLVFDCIERVMINSVPRTVKSLQRDVSFDLGFLIWWTMLLKRHKPTTTPHSHLQYAGEQV